MTLYGEVCRNLLSRGYKGYPDKDCPLSLLPSITLHDLLDNYVKQSLVIDQSRESRGLVRFRGGTMGLDSGVV